MNIFFLLSSAQFASTKAPHPLPKVITSRKRLMVEDRRGEKRDFFVLFFLMIALTFLVLDISKFFLTIFLAFLKRSDIKHYQFKVINLDSLNINCDNMPIFSSFLRFPWLVFLQCPLLLELIS